MHYNKMNQNIKLSLFRAKIFLRRNTVYDNRNYIPFYKAEGETGNDKPDYGTEDQTYIIDGSGEC